MSAEGWPFVLGAVSGFVLLIAALDRWLPQGVIEFVDRLLGGGEWRK